MRSSKRKRRIPVIYKTRKEGVRKWISTFGKHSLAMMEFYANRMIWSSKRQKGLSNIEKVAMFINRMVTGQHHSEIASKWGVSQSTAIQVFREVLWKFNIFFNGVFRLPTEEEANKLKTILRLRGDDLWQILFVTDGIHIASPIAEGWDSCI